MKRRTAKYYAAQVYSLAMRNGIYAMESKGIIAVYHQGLCYVWQRDFAGVEIVTPAKAWR